MKQNTDYILDKFESRILNLEADAAKAAVQHEAKPSGRTLRDLLALRLQACCLGHEFEQVFGTLSDAHDL